MRFCILWMLHSGSFVVRGRLVLLAEGLTPNYVQSGVHSRATSNRVRNATKAGFPGCRVTATYRERRGYQSGFVYHSVLLGTARIEEHD